MNRGQIWTLLLGSRQYRVLIVSNDEYNALDDLPVCALAVQRDTPAAGHLAVTLTAADPLVGAKVRIHSFVKIPDRSALRENHGYVSHPTMQQVEENLREFLELP